VTLYKGHLGVGVTEPSGQLELAGDERIQEYPPGPMDGYETLIPGHGVFCASASTWVVTTFEPYFAFDNNNSTAWLSAPTYDGTDGSYTGSVTTGNIDGTGTLSGEWLQISLPSKIFLKRSGWIPQGTTRGPKTGVILGSNNGSVWNTIHSFSDKTYSGTIETELFSGTSSTAYQYFRVVGSTIEAGARLEAREWKLFGTPGPTTLDKGSLSLTRSLDVPRVSRYDVDTETPRPEKLVVDFDTTVNSSPTDISGKGNHGTLVGATYSPADKAFVFDGGDDINVELPSSVTGAYVHSMSLWFTHSGTGNALYTLVHIGDVNNSENVMSDLLVYDTGKLRFGFFANDSDTAVGLINLNQWYHVVVTYSGGTGNAGSRKLYLNGEEISLTLSGNFLNNSLSLPSNPKLYLGSQQGSLKLTGQISNFKLYNVALEPSEVQKLYRLGRTGRSMVISDTAVGIGKVPEAQLDVRGVVRSDGILMKYDGNIEHVRDGGIMLSRAGLGTSTDGYSSQPIIFDGGDSDAGNDTNLRGGAIWSQWGGSQYGLAFRGANYDDVYPYPESPAMFVTKDKVGINQNSPTAKLHIKPNHTSYTNPGDPIGAAGIAVCNETNSDAAITHSILSLRTGGSSGGDPFVSYDVANEHGWSVGIDNSEGTQLRFSQSWASFGSTKAYISVNSTAAEIDFTGQHRSFIDTIAHTDYLKYEGLIVSANKNQYFDIQEEIVTGVQAIKINESLPLVSISNVAYDKCCFGVISGSEDTNDREYSQGSFVSVLKKQDGDIRAHVNSVGEGAIWVVNTNGILESGDYITTSNVAGYGQKQDSEFLANYTVAKITMDCDFNPSTQPTRNIKRELRDVNYWVKYTYDDISEEEYTRVKNLGRRVRIIDGGTEISHEEYENHLKKEGYTITESNTYIRNETTHQRVFSDKKMEPTDGFNLEVRNEPANVLDEHGQIQWEDHPTETEKAYKIRYLDADGNITDEANAVHKAAFVGCTYHCG
jgi:hypothetical protein